MFSRKISFDSAQKKKKLITFEMVSSCVQRNSKCKPVEKRWKQQHAIRIRRKKNATPISNFILQQDNVFRPFFCASSFSASRAVNAFVMCCCVFIFCFCSCWIRLNLRRIFFEFFLIDPTIESVWANNRTKAQRNGTS